MVGGAGRPRATAAARAESLDRELQARAPEVLQFLKSNHCRNVGVLKFLVQQGPGKPQQDDTGAVSLDMARRLTVALVWAQDPPPKKEDEVGIIRDADAVAACRLPDADYRKSEGRQKLLAADYPLAWGDGKLIVKPDGFLTGVVEFQSNLSKVTVRLKYIDGDGEHPIFDEDHAIQAEPDSATLVAGGLSFLRRDFRIENVQPKLDPANPPPPPKPNPGTLAASALKVKEGKPNDFPLKDKEAPVELEIDYGDVPQLITIRTALRPSRNQRKARRWFSA